MRIDRIAPALARALLIAGALSLPGASAGAQWFYGPGWKYGYRFTYTTDAVFSCSNAHYLFAGGSCAAAGNQVTIGHDGAYLNIAFQGLSGAGQTSNLGDRLRVGTITTSLSGTGDFTFPLARAATLPIFIFALHLSVTGPLASDGWNPRGYNVVSPTRTVWGCCDWGVDGFEIETTPNPGRGVGGSASFYNLSAPAIDAADASYELWIDTSMTPEPATLALLAPALLALGAVVRLRRR